MNHHIDPVEQRAADPAKLVLAAPGRLVALPRGIAEVAAAAWVHGRHKLEPSRVGHMCCGPRHRRLAGLQRLAQRLERGPWKLGKLVQEQYAPVRQTDLAGVFWHRDPASLTRGVPTPGGTNWIDDIASSLGVGADMIEGATLAPWRAALGGPSMTARGDMALLSNFGPEY